VNTIHPCPLCLSTPEVPYTLIQGRKIHTCRICKLIYVDRTEHLSPIEEKRRYENHQNSTYDKGYCKFLNRLTDPLLKVLPQGSEGLDYGCGPGPTLSKIMSKKGYSVADYDPFFFNQVELLTRKYDFITCTEVIEHFFYVAEELEKLLAMLKENGILAIMTELVETETLLSEWYYMREPSHVCFFSSETMEWIASTYELEMTIPHRNVRFFKAKSQIQK